MSDFIECGKEVAKQSAPLAWEEKIASWLNKGKLLGNKVVARREMYASPAVVSLLAEYRLSCMQPEGKVIVLFGDYGTGKTCTLYSIVHGPAKGSWCPLKSMLITPLQEQVSGNKWMESLRYEMQYPETLKAAHFGQKLIRTAAREKSLFKNLLEKLGKSQNEDTPRPQIAIHDLLGPDVSFDDGKKAVIAIDNVEFSFKEGERNAEQHSDFFEFALALKDSAHAVGVVVVFGTKNLALCKALSILNGFSKICPADISSSKDLASYDEKYKVTEIERRLPRTLALDGRMGWTTTSMEKCLISKFPGLTMEKSKELAISYAAAGNIRDAVADAVSFLAEETLPKVTTKSTGTSTSIDSGEISRPSLADANFGTSNTGDESDEDQSWLDAKMARCGMDC